MADLLKWKSSLSPLVTYIEKNSVDIFLIKKNDIQYL